MSFSMHLYRECFDVEDSITVNIRILKLIKERRYTDTPLSPEQKFIEFLSQTEESIFEWRLELTTPDGFKGACLLHISVMYNLPLLTDWLLERGLSPNIRDTQGVTPLNSACYRNREVHIRSLLEYEADPNIPDRDGYLPIHYIPDNPSIVRLLIQHASTINSFNILGETPLLCACRLGYSTKAILLIMYGADRICTKEGDSDFHVAAKNTSKTFALELLESNFGPHIQEQKLKKYH